MVDVAKTIERGGYLLPLSSCITARWALMDLMWRIRRSQRRTVYGHGRSAQTESLR